MTLSTVDATARPTSRVLILKDIADGQLEFASSRASRKGHELAARPWAAANFHWPRARPPGSAARPRPRRRPRGGTTRLPRPPARVGRRIARRPPERAAPRPRRARARRRRGPPAAARGPGPCPEPLGAVPHRARRGRVLAGRPRPAPHPRELHPPRRAVPPFAAVALTGHTYGPPRAGPPAAHMAVPRDFDFARVRAANIVPRPGGQAHVHRHPRDDPRRLERDHRVRALSGHLRVRYVRAQPPGRRERHLQTAPQRLPQMTRVHGQSMPQDGGHLAVVVLRRAASSGPKSGRAVPDAPSRRKRRSC